MSCENDQGCQAISTSHVQGGLKHYSLEHIQSRILIVNKLSGYGFWGVVGLYEAVMAKWLMCIHIYLHVVEGSTLAMSTSLFPCVPLH